MDQKPPSQSKWYYGIIAVLSGLFLLGPFAFPLLWKSPHFNAFWKVFLTVAVTVATFVMIWGTWGVVNLILNEFKRAALI